ncbi:ribosomal protein S8 [Culex quinquefasciatus]|uniref:Ribosomal protein S8 n=1 Tax=Culex quinquefasciatus TaxID=7176 RepID=B0XHV1_CULQU|nr:ribosomal protein S8 [Culex quinquefasciatus]|eukprot:XP_001869223.1 ribosomal protein S8 [Culex quinquefasciatus]
MEAPLAASINGRSNELAALARTPVRSGQVRTRLVRTLNVYECGDSLIGTNADDCILHGRWKQSTQHIGTTGTTVPHDKLNKESFNLIILEHGIRLLAALTHRSITIPAGYRSTSWYARPPNPRSILCEPLWKQEGLCAPSGRQQLCLGFGGMHAIDAAPFHQWYENHYLQPLDKKRDLKAS